MTTVRASQGHVFFLLVHLEIIMTYNIVMCFLHLRTTLQWKGTYLEAKKRQATELYSVNACFSV